MSSFDYKKSSVYFRDDFVSFDKANISIASSPVLYGLSIYTVFNVKWNNESGNLYIFRLPDHYKRLVDSAKIMDFHSFIEDWNFERFEQIMIELIKKNNIREDVLVRASVFIDEFIAGTKIHGLQNSLSAYIYPMGEILNKRGIHACISSWLKTPDNAIPARAKINGGYANASLAKNEALLNGYDEAIFIDESGHVCEATVANIFLVKKDTIITPETHSDILEGITRNSVLKMAEKLGLKTQERVVDRSELYTADEIFLSGSSANITPVLSVDKRSIGSASIGDITKRLAETYEDIRLGKDKEFTDWITEVNQL